MSEREALLAMREQIDAIDAQLVPLLEQRMKVVGQVAQFKRENNMPILDAAREQQIIDKLVGTGDPAYQTEISLLIRTMLTLSKAHQHTAIHPGAAAPLLPAPRKPVAGDITCAYQGVPGAWSEQAVIKLFPDAKRERVEYFSDVFKAVKEGRVNYGVVAIENSRTGAIGETYDLLRQYGCYIVGRVGIDIRHCLLAPAGVKLDDVRQVLSHPQALQQCSHYVKKHRWEQVACRNTAVAAETVAQEQDGMSAAIGSRRAAELTGLEVLAPDIMNSAGNRTWFVVIADQPEYDETSGLISVTFSTAHRSGALCESLMPFMAGGLNLARIESRPGTQDSYRFFAEIEGNILDPDTVQALRQSAAASEYFEVIGCYNQI